MANKRLIAFVVFASVASAVPSRAEFHPIRAANDPISDDLTGSGYEVGNRASVSLGAKRDGESPEAKVAQQWRDLAQRTRRLAMMLSGPEQQDLLDRAEHYEARAKRMDSLGGPG